MLVVIGVGGTIYYLTQVQNKEPQPIDNSTQATLPTVKNNQPLLSPTPISSVNQEQQKKFQSTQYKFSLAYPINWSYKENEPSVPNLAEYTVTFSSPDGNTVLDVWVKSGSWSDVERDILKEKDATESTIAGYSVIVQPINRGSITFIKHPSITNKILVLTSSGENLNTTDQIQKTLRFE